MDLGISVLDVFYMMGVVIVKFWWVILILMAPGILNLVIKRMKKDKKIGPHDFSKYALRKSVLTKNELKFYESLKEVVGEKQVIYPR